MEIPIGAKVFKTKKKATEYVSGLLKKYSPGDVVDFTDHNFLLALLSRHPEAHQKEGPGVAYFSREQAPKFNSPCFHLHRIDGSSTDFSTVSCINGKGPSLIYEFREACRSAVGFRVAEKRISMYDEGNGTVIDVDTGKTLNKKQCWIVQVSPTWLELVNEFISVNKIKVSKNMLTKPKDNQYWAEFVDQEIAEQFIEFHKPLMNLVPKEINKDRSLDEFHS